MQIEATGFCERVRVGRPSERIVEERPRAGFSLFELLFVMVLIGVLVSIVAPRIDIGRSAVDAGVLEVQMAVAASRGQAIVQQHDLVMTFDQEANRFFVLHDANNSGVRDEEERYSVVPLADGASFGRGAAEPLDGASEAISFSEGPEGMPTLDFHRNGAASEEGTVYITSLRAVGGGGFAEDSRALVIERSTGRVHCYSYRTLAWSEGC